MAHNSVSAFSNEGNKWPPTFPEYSGGGFGNNLFAQTIVNSKFRVFDKVYVPRAHNRAYRIFIWLYHLYFTWLHILIMKRSSIKDSKKK